MSKTTSFLRGQWERSPLRRLGRWFFRWKTLKKTSFVLACLATLIALFYAAENWRGRRAWNRYEASLRSRGEPVHVARLVPAAVPDSNNFAAVPFIQLVFAERGRNLGEHWEDYGRASQRLKRVRAVTPKGKSPRWGPADLVAWDYAFRNYKLGETNENLELPPIGDSASRSNAARAVLEWLGVYDPVLDELRAAASRPESRYPLEYDTPNPFGMHLPHLAALKRICQILALRAEAELAAGNPAAAADDVRLILRVSDSLETEPLLISQLVRISCFDTALRVIRGGLDAGHWTAQTLAEFERRLGEYDFLDELRLALQGERAFCNSMFDYLRAQPKEAEPLLDSPMDGVASPLGFLLFGAPRGWLYMEQVNYNRLFDLHMIPFGTSENPRVDPKLIKERSRQLDDLLYPNSARGTPLGALLKHQQIARLFLPALENAFVKFARAQALAEMASMGCALETYRRATGTYPRDLETLKPAYLNALPIEVVGTEPYRYRLEPDGGFRLYSVGWNQTDDGGEEGKNNQTGDWVWR